MNIKQNLCFLLFLLLGSAVTFGQNSNKIVNGNKLSDNLRGLNYSSHKTIKQKPIQTAVQAAYKGKPFSQRKYTIHFGMAANTVQIPNYFDQSYSWYSGTSYELVETSSLMTVGSTIAFEIRNKDGKFAYYIPITIITDILHTGSVISSGLKWKYFFLNKSQVFQMYAAPSLELGLNSLKYYDASDSLINSDGESSSRLNTALTAFIGMSVNALPWLNFTFDYGYGANILFKEFGVSNNTYTESKMSGGGQMNFTMGVNF